MMKTKAYDKLTKSVVRVIGPAGGFAAKNCVVIQHADGQRQIQFKSLLKGI
jgi:hypothetical protein